MMDKCRVVFMCVFYVSLWCVVIAVAAEKFQEKEVVQADVEVQTKEKYFNRRMVDFYETFIEGAVDVSDYLFMAWRSYKRTNCKLTKPDGVNLKETFDNLYVMINSTAMLTKETLRPMAAGNNDRKTIKTLRETINNKERVSPQLLKEVKSMTVPLAEVEKAIPAITAKIGKIEQEIEKIENLLQSENTETCFKKGTAKKWLGISRNVLTKIQTAAEKAEKWQEELLAEPKLETIEENKADEPQQTKETKEEEENKSKEKELIGHGDKKTDNENLSFDGSVTVGFHASVLFILFLHLAPF